MIIYEFIHCASRVLFDFSSPWTSPLHNSVSTRWLTPKLAPPSLAQRVVGATPLWPRRTGIGAAPRSAPARVEQQIWSCRAEQLGVAVVQILRN